MILELRDAVQDSVAHALAADGLEDVPARIELNLDEPGRGDLSSPTPLEAGARYDRDPRNIADGIAARQSGTLPGIIADVTVDGPGYVNYHLDDDRLFREVVSEINRQGADYGATDGDELYVMDVSSPNVAKPLHIGHLRNTVMGLSLANILEERGTEVIRDNHLGDWGTQFGNLMYAYDQHQRGVDDHGIFDAAAVEHDFDDDPVEHLLGLYQAFGRREKALEKAGDDADLEALRDSGRAWFRRLKEGDPAALDLWETFRQVSIDRFRETYDILGAEFDEWIGEGFYVQEGYTDQVVERALDMGVARRKPDGSVFIPLDVEQVGDEEQEVAEFTIRKSDGTTLYATRDLATIEYRRQEFDPDMALYVVASEQDDYFADLFRAADRLGYDADDLFHVSYGLVNLPGASMSTREGTMVRARELLNEAEQNALEHVRENKPDLPEDRQQEIARKVGLAAVNFENVSVSRDKDVTFVMDQAVSFEGETGPYIQYAATRAQSMLDEAGTVPDLPADLVYNDQDQELVRQLARYEVALDDAMDAFDPAPVARYLADAAQSFNRFYHQNRVLDADNRDERLALTNATYQVLENGAGLLGIEMLDEM